MQKLFTKPEGGYIIFEEDNGKQFPYPKDSNYAPLEGGGFEVREEGGRKGVRNLSNPSQIFNQAGTVAYTEATLETFLRENTGK